MTATQQAQQFQRPPLEVPSNITSSRAKLVYFFIKSHNGVTVNDMVDTLNDKKLNIYGALKQLEQSDHITKSNGAYY